MSAKKKKETPTQATESIIAEQENQPQQEPQPEVPERQVEETTIENQVEPPAESKVEPEPAVVEKPAESIATKPETTPIVEVPAPKPKPPTLASLRADLDELRQIVLQQSELISQLQATPPVRLRKPVANNGKISVRDKETGRIFSSKNSAYQTLLKEGALDDLVKQGIFGDLPSKNGWGCYAMFRALPNKFEFLKSEVKDASTEIPQV